MVNAYKKGANFEREIANDLGKRFNTKVRRTPNSGGIVGFMRQDIICQDPKSIVNDLFIECKKQQSLNGHKTYWRTREVCAGGKKPIVVWKKNNDPEPVVILGYGDFCNLLEIIEEYRNLSEELREQIKE